MDCTFDWQDVTQVLCVTYLDKHWDAERSNATVLRVLLDAELPLREVRCFSELETECLTSRSPG
jgi:hypothetical protein